MPNAARSGALGYVLVALITAACSGRASSDLFDSEMTTGGNAGAGGSSSGAGGSSSTVATTTTGSGGSSATSGGSAGSGAMGVGGSGGSGGAATSAGGAGGAGGAAGAVGGAGGSGGDAVDAGTNAVDAAAGAAGQGGGSTVDVIAVDACVPTGVEACDGLDNDCNGNIDGQTCPDGCIGIARGRAGYMLCYGSNRQSTWHDASAVCTERGMHLARVDDAQENAFIHEAALKVNFNGSLWLGGSDSANEGRWVWMDGAQFWMGNENGTAVGGSYVNWDQTTNQPGGGTAQDCLEM